MKKSYNLESLTGKMKKYEGSNCMMIRKSYDLSTSLDRRGGEKSPAIDWHIKGGFEVSLLRALLVLIGILTFMAAVGMMCRGAVYGMMSKKLKRKYKKKMNADK